MTLIEYAKSRGIYNNDNRPKMWWDIAHSVSMFGLLHEMTPIIEKLDTPENITNCRFIYDETYLTHHENKPYNDSISISSALLQDTLSDAGYLVDDGIYLEDTPVGRVYEMLFAHGITEISINYFAALLRAVIKFKHNASNLIIEKPVED